MKWPNVVFLAAAASIMIGCSLKEPGDPSWQVDLTVPVADRIYSLADIVDSPSGDTLGNWASSDTSSDSLGIPYLNFADSLDDNPVGDELQFDPFSGVSLNPFGALVISTPAAQNTSFFITEIAPQFPPGQTILIPAFAFGTNTHNLSAFDQFDWAVFLQGEISLTLTNTLPVPVSDVIIRVYQQSPYVLIWRWTVGATVQPGDSISGSSSLTPGQQLDNADWAVDISGSSPGSSVPVLIKETDALHIEVSLSSLKAAAAQAHFISQSITRDTTFVIEETDSVRSALIRSGSLSFTMTNNSNLINTVTFILSDFTLNGQPFTQLVTLLPHETQQFSSLDLAGYFLNRPDQDNRIKATDSCFVLDTADPLYIPYTQNAMVALGPSDLVQIQFQISELLFSYFEGVLDGTHEIPIDQQFQSLETIPGGLDSLSVESAFADVHLKNTIGFPVVTYLTLIAYKNGSQAISRNLPPLPVPAAQMNTPGLLDTTVAGLADIVNVLPDSILPTGRSVIMAGDGSAQDDQYVDGYYHIYSPFFFTLGETTLEPDLTTFDEGFEEDIKQVELRLDLVNHMPLTGTALILASYDSTQFESANPDANLDTLMIAPLPAAQLDVQGYVIQPGISEVGEVLDEGELALFDSSSPDSALYVQTRININSTEGNTVRCHTSDHITVGASAHLTIEMNSDEGD